MQLINMFRFFKNNKKEIISEKKKPNKLVSGLKNILSISKKIDSELFEELEALLISSDIGINTAEEIIQSVRNKANNKHLNDPNSLYALIKEELKSLLVKNNQLIIEDKKPFVILVVGVNGAGKTTTIGKLAKKLTLQGKSVMLGAGDTFRAAAIDQLKVWGERNNIPVIAGKQGGDSAAILYDALSSAKAKNIDVLIADTSGRLHTQDNLMAELSKIKKVLAKDDALIPHETMLVVDGSAGQNAINQGIEFNKAVSLSGITITKLDGSAKGGVVFALSNQLNLPIRFVGTGESIEDLQVFNAEDFINSIFDD